MSTCPRISPTAVEGSDAVHDSVTNLVNSTFDKCEETAKMTPAFH